MSKSLAVINGDLVIGPGRSYQIVSGKDKLKQDLKLWVLERIGSDPLLPDYGSLFDGGIVNGQTQESYIGNVANPQVLSELRALTIKLVNNYQTMQYNKMQDEAVLYQGKNTLDSDEVIDKLTAVNVVQSGTTILIQVVISTLAGSLLKVTIPLDQQA